MNNPINWNNAKFIIVAPSGNIGFAQTFKNAGQLAIQLDWKTTPTDEDIAFSQKAIMAVMPDNVDSLMSARARDKEDSDRQIAAFLNAVNN